MADYDSDSSGAEDIETNVLLGYASREPTSDEFSQMGGHPTWLDGNTAPNGTLAKCKVCNSFMSLLLQLNGDIPDRFPGHERRLYLWTCRRKACRRKEGSIRGFRAIRSSTDSIPRTNSVATKQGTAPETKSNPPPAINLGETLFGVKPPTSSSANPFASSASINPFAATSTLAAKPPQPPSHSTTETLPATFAEKVRISSPPPSTSSPSPSPSQPTEPWPAQSSFPTPYPRLHLDADKEYIDPTPPGGNLAARAVEDTGDGSSSSSAAEDKLAFESSMDRTFQRFADRLAQNPEQVLRYEFGGAPLLYSKGDAVGKKLAPFVLGGSSGSEGGGAGKVKTVKREGGGDGEVKLGLPRCENCGAERVFELQLTPHAILELESEDMGLEGMDWGTVMLGVCSRDCGEKGREAGDVGYVEEWIGVQWEELAKRK